MLLVIIGFLLTQLLSEQFYIGFWTWCVYSLHKNNAMQNKAFQVLKKCVYLWKCGSFRCTACLGLPWRSTVLFCCCGKKQWQEGQRGKEREHCKWCEGVLMSMDFDSTLSRAPRATCRCACSHTQQRAHSHTHMCTLLVWIKREAHECVDQQAAQHKLKWVQLRDRGCLFSFSGLIAAVRCCFLCSHCALN